MRDIKFRAWMKPEFSAPNASYDTFTLAELASGKYDVSKWESFEQFTGLADRDGRDIYEGDILRHQYFYSPEFSFEQFEREERIEVKLPDFFEHVARMLENSRETREEFVAHMEVIGNVHQNPELINGDANV